MKLDDRMAMAHRVSCMGITNLVIEIKLVLLTLFLFYILSPFGKMEKFLKGDSGIKIYLSVPNKYVIGDFMYP